MKKDTAQVILCSIAIAMLSVYVAIKAIDSLGIASLWMLGLVILNEINNKQEK